MINHDLIEALIISDITGNITEEEKSCLEQLLAESEEAREYSNRVYKVLESDGAKRARKAFSRVAPQPKPVNHKKRISPYSIGVGIAAMLAIIMYVFHVISNHSNIDNIDLSAAKDVRLVFKDEKIVKLDHADTLAELAGVQLSIRPDTLTYEAKTAHDNESVTLIVPEGKHQFFAMSDGTTLSVNSGTTVRFPFGFKGSTREIRVDGEAYIKVAPDEKKPFIVHMNNSTVRVLGTEFNVNSHDGQEKISLVSGKVKVFAGDDNVTLLPGKEVLLLPGAGPIVSSFNTEEMLKRQIGEFAYAHMTPKKLEKLIQRYYGVQVQLNDGDQNPDLSGVINRKKSIDTFLNKLKMKHKIIRDTSVVIN